MTLLRDEHANCAREKKNLMALEITHRARYLHGSAVKKNRTSAAESPEGGKYFAR